MLNNLIIFCKNYGLIVLVVDIVYSCSLVKINEMYGLKQSVSLSCFYDFIVCISVYCSMTECMRVHQQF